MIRSKMCVGCITIRPLTAFVKRRGGLGGVDRKCKACRKLERRLVRRSGAVKQCVRLDRGVA